MHACRHANTFIEVVIHIYRERGDIEKVQRRRVWPDTCLCDMGKSASDR